MEVEINRALSANSIEVKVDGLKEIMDKCVANPNGLETVVQAISENILESNATAGKTLMQHYISIMKKIKTDQEEVALAGLRALGSQVSNYEEIDSNLRYFLFDYYINTGSYGEAARTLTNLACEYRYSAEEKAELYVKIAETFLEEDESIDAEAYVSKASGLMHAVPNEHWSLHLRYRVTLARTLDARRKFLEAAISYYELSQARHEKISSENLLALLSKAITCALLGPAGPQRARILATLYKDERVSALMAPLPEYAPHATVLSKMCTGQLVYKRDIAALEETLLPHHKAILADGLTIPERATIQHNLVALSHIYANLTFEQLAMLLDIESDRALQVAARMISDNRLSASIDQVDGLLIFQFASSNAEAQLQHSSLQAFDDHISNLCTQVNTCYDKIEPLLS